MGGFVSLVDLICTRYFFSVSVRIESGDNGSMVLLPSKTIIHLKWGDERTRSVSHSYWLFLFQSAAAERSGMRMRDFGSEIWTFPNHHLN